MAALTIRPLVGPGRFWVSDGNRTVEVTVPARLMRDPEFPLREMLAEEFDAVNRAFEARLP